MSSLIEQTPLDILDIKTYEKSTTYKFLPDIVALTEPLKKINIPYFSYIEFDPCHQDQRVKALVNDDNVVRYFIKNNGEEIEFANMYAIKSGLYPRTIFPMPNNKIKRYYTGRAEINQTIDELTFVFDSNGLKKTYCFGISSFMGLNFDMLEAFINYFNEKAEGLIKKSTKILLGINAINPNQLQEIAYKDKLATFLKEIKYSEYKLYNIANKYHLSRREVQCLDLIMQNKINKEIAYALGLKQKTIDIYIERLKNKLRCRTKLELILKTAQI